MADINLGSGDDSYTQPEAKRDEFNNVFGLEGNDTIKAYQGTVIGGPGNDRIERLVIAAEPWRQVGAAYWNSPTGILANLAEGWIDDGWGTRDTVVGVTSVHGSGQNDRFIGDAANNFFHPNGGTDSIDGGAGFDGFDVREIPPNADGSGNWRPARMDDLNISVAVDGRSATVSVKHFPKITYSVTNMEYFRLIEASNTQYLLADFIAPQAMAEQAIAAGGNLRWNTPQALGSAINLSFSFVTAMPVGGIGAPGFRAFSAAEQQLVRDILAQTSLVTQISFNEVVESGSNSGQLRFGVSQQANTKGQTFMPGQNGEQAGDVWMDVESMHGISAGSEGYQALLHEIGHALGLRHPRNVDAGDAWTTQLRAQDDRLALSVMSQTPSAGGLYRAEWGPLDVLALRHLYGTRSSNSSDSVYVLGNREASAMTVIVDDGGTDLLDASRLSTGVSLDLVPGHLGSAGITPAGLSGVDNLGLSAASWIENAIGSAFDDVLLGNERDNQLSGGLGNDWIEGAGGSDTALFAGKRSDYALSGAFGKVFVEARDGVSGFDTLVGIEQLRFADQSWPLADTVFASDVNHTLDEDTRLAADLPDPADVARGSVSYRLVGNGEHGVATVNAAGQLNYTPVANFWGRDAITFEINGIGGTVGSNRYIAFLDVLPVNDAAPVSKNIHVLAASAGTLKGQLPTASDIDNDPIAYTLAADARNGAVFVAGNGSFNYTATLGFNGSDSFGFSVSDGAGGSNRYSASVTVQAVAASREGSAAADTLIGLTAADGLFGLAGNDRMTGGGGNDVIEGGAGIDTAVFSSGRVAYDFRGTDFGWTVQDNTNSEGRDSLAGIERLEFANTSVALDLDGNAGSVAQIIRALFGSSFLNNKYFVGIGLQLFDGGMAYAEVVKLALGTDLFAQLAGARSNTAFVNHVYKNVIGVAPSAAELASFAGALDAGGYTQDSLALVACQIGFNATSVELVGLASTGIEFSVQG